MIEDKDRPMSVPNEAIWKASDNEWELGARNENGKYIGEWKWWLAPNGHLCCHTFFDDAGNMLSFKRFHPNGEVSREGVFENGVQKQDIYYKSSEPTTEVFAYGNSNDDVYKAVKKPGVPVEFDYYDREGNHLNAPIEQKELVAEEGFTVTEEEVATIKKVILTEGKSFIQGQFDKEYINETIIPILVEKTEAKNIVFTDVGGIFMQLAKQAIETEKDVVFHDGNLHLSSLHCMREMGMGVIIVNGDLTVDGSIHLSDDLMQLLFVTGNVKANNVTTSGMFFVFENLTVTNSIIGDYNHGSAFIGGNMHAKFFYPEEYFFEVLGSTQFTYAFGNSWRLNQNQNPEAFNYNNKKLGDFIGFLHKDIHAVADFENQKKLLEKPCVEEGLFDFIDSHEFYSYVNMGKPVFKD